MQTQSTPTVSVALGTHNGAQWIAEQVESILAQSLLPIEIVLSDDASTDDTVAIAERVVAGRLPLRLLRNEPALGVTGNFEQAALACTGELIALCDQDDARHPNRLETMVAAFAARPGLLLLHGDARLVDSAGQSLGHTLFEALELSAEERELVHSGQAFDALLRRNLATGATTVFRRSLLDTATPFPRQWVHDEWLAIIAAATGEVDLLEAALVDYRQHGGNQIGATRLSLVGKVRRVSEPRAARNERLATNFGLLVEKLEALEGIDPAKLEGARGKLAHERIRRDLPVIPILRIVPVLREVASGRYRRFSRGPADILRDLVQPAD